MSVAPPSGRPIASSRSAMRMRLEMAPFAGSKSQRSSHPARESEWNMVRPSGEIEAMHRPARDVALEECMVAIVVDRPLAEFAADVVQRLEVDHLVSPVYARAVLTTEQVHLTKKTFAVRRLSNCPAIFLHFPN